MNSIMKYFNEKYVRVLRTFSVASAHYAEVQEISTGYKIVVKVEELSDKPQENGDKPAVVMIQDEISVKNANNHIEVSTDGVRVKADKINLEADVESVKEEPKVIATNAKGKEFNLGTLELIETNNNFKKFKLDKEAVERVLEGVQKSHKGFTFTTK